jgi:hypothetical protein
MHSPGVVVWTSETCMSHTMNITFGNEHKYMHNSLTLEWLPFLEPLFTPNYVK